MPGSDHYSPFVTASFENAEELSAGFLAAAQDGVLLIKDLPFSAPFPAMRALFDRLYDFPELVTKTNAAYTEERLIVKISDRATDKKVPLDLSTKSLAALAAVPGLRSELGPDFDAVASFFENAGKVAVPRLLDALSQVLAGPAGAWHSEGNINFRACDYPALSETENEANSIGVVRCGAHRDFGTLTLVMDDGSGGLEVMVNGEWRPIPPGAACVTFGWCAAIASNDRLVAPAHRVVTAPGAARRCSAVIFVAPDNDAKLRPLCLTPGEVPQYASGRLTVAQFKMLMAGAWRWREGTLAPEVHAMGEAPMGQEEVVERLLRAPARAAAERPMNVGSASGILAEAF